MAPAKRTRRVPTPEPGPTAYIAEVRYEVHVDDHLDRTYKVTRRMGPAGSNPPTLVVHHSHFPEDARRELLRTIKEVRDAVGPRGLTCVGLPGVRAEDVAAAADARKAACRPPNPPTVHDVDPPLRKM